jgi:hypothetical protein
MRYFDNSGSDPNHRLAATLFAIFTHGNGLESSGSIEMLVDTLLFLLGITSGNSPLANHGSSKTALNTSSARRKMWGEDGNDARFIKLSRW